MVLVGLGITLTICVSTSAVYEDQFTWPMDGTVTSEYWECRDDCDRYHRAIDVANGCGTPIYPARAGTANVASDPDGYGNYVLVEHGDGWSSLFAHMRDVEVLDGDNVDRSTVLGYEGDTGASTGCHVHFEIRQANEGDAVKQFLPGRIDEVVEAGEPVPVETGVVEVTSDSTRILDGPNVSQVPGEGDQRIRTADSGDRFATYSSWTNTDEERWMAVSVDGRIGWIQAADVAHVAATTVRVSVDTALNVRSGPGTSHTDVGDVYGAQSYDVLTREIDDDGEIWFQIPYTAPDHDRETGWIHSGWTNTVAHGSGGPLEGYEILLDPGHGGEDAGASDEGVEEKGVVLNVSLRAKDLLVAEGAEVVMTRSIDETVSLEERTEVGNTYEVDRFVSVHANACGDCGADGTETYYHDSLSSTSSAADLANAVQAHTVEEAGTTDRGVKQANFHVLRESPMPAILLETAFVDHDEDRALLTSGEGQQSFARGIEAGLLEHLEDTDDDPVGPEPLDRLDEGFETPLENWTVLDEGGPASWQRTDERAREGAWSIAIRAYGPGEDDALTTPPVDLANMTHPRLVLDSWIDAERSCSLLGCRIYDHGTIEISADGGDTWETLKANYWSSDGWETLGFDLSLHDSDVVQVRFSFHSDSATHNEGWYLDHVELFDADPVRADGFEEDSSAWTVEDRDGPAAWKRTNARASPGSWSMALADYGAHEDDVLFSEPIDLTGRRAPQLSLASWIEAEERCGLLWGCTVYDGGSVAVSTDDGATWRRLLDDYSDSEGWEHLDFDLTPEAGETVVLRFAFASDDSTHNEGWYVDDVRIG